MSHNYDYIHHWRALSHHFNIKNKKDIMVWKIIYSADNWSKSADNWVESPDNWVTPNLINGDKLKTSPCLKVYNWYCNLYMTTLQSTNVMLQWQLIKLGKGGFSPTRLVCCIVKYCLGQRFSCLHRWKKVSQGTSKNKTYA